MAGVNTTHLKGRLENAEFGAEDAQQPCSRDEVHQAKYQASVRG